MRVELTDRERAALKAAGIEVFFRDTPEWKDSTDKKKGAGLSEGNDERATTDDDRQA